MTAQDPPLAAPDLAPDLGADPQAPLRVRPSGTADTSARASIPASVASSDEVTVAVHDLGGEGPLLLLAHATGFCGPVWQPLADTLGSQFHCVALDFRAHGASTRPVGRSLEWAGMVDDVLAVVEAISPDRPVAAVGHSMGGGVLALAEDRRPGTISQAWCFEPILFRQVEHEQDAELPAIAEAARRRRPSFASREEVLERYRSRPPLSLLDPRALQAYVDHGFRDADDGTVTLCCRPEDECDVFLHHNAGALEASGRLGVPYAVAVGFGDDAPAQLGREAAALHPKLELIDYPDLTHFGPLQAPDRLAVDIGRWLTTERS
jgi:pimeloyl-ACP methyl ester carboxylesterase